MRALLIPADPNQPLDTVDLAVPASLAKMLEGTAEAIVSTAFPELRGYRNGDATPGSGGVNLRASRLFGDLRALGGSIAGDVIVVGRNHADVDRDCPPTAELRLRQPAHIGVPEPLPSELRCARLRWETGDNGAGRITGAVLEIGYRAGVKSHTRQRIGPNHFAAQLRWESQEPAPKTAAGSEPGTIYGRLGGDGLSVVRETVPRYTRRGLAAFTELAIARVRELAATGDDRIAPYFT